MAETLKEKQEAAARSLPGFLKVPTVARLLAVSNRTVLKLIADGRLEAVQYDTGGHWFIPRESYEAYAAALIARAKARAA